MDSLPFPTRSQVVYNDVGHFSELKYSLHLMFLGPFSSPTKHLENVYFRLIMRVGDQALSFPKYAIANTYNSIFKG